LVIINGLVDFLFLGFFELHFDHILDFYFELILYDFPDFVLECFVDFFFEAFFDLFGNSFPENILNIVSVDIGVTVFTVTELIKIVRFGLLLSGVVIVILGHLIWDYSEMYLFV